MPANSGLLSIIDEALVIRLYGKKLPDLSLDPKSLSDSLIAKHYSGLPLGFASVYGADVFGKCYKSPSPFIAIVPGPGEDPVGCGEFSDPKVYRMWTLSKGDPLVKLKYEVGTAEAVAVPEVTPLVDVDADFHIHDVKLTGTVVSAKLRSYLRLRQSTPFGNIDVTVIDRDDTISFDFNQIPCITVFSIAVASAQICFHANPNRICGEVVVGVDLPIIGHWGQTFTIACVNL